MKSIILMIYFSILTMAGGYGEFVFSCTSPSLRTHLNFHLNDYDYDYSNKTALYPKRIVISVMGNIKVLYNDKKSIYQFKTVKNKDSLLIYSTDNEQTYKFTIHWNEGKTAKVTINRAENPRTQAAFKKLSLNCTQYHDL